MDAGTPGSRTVLTASLGDFVGIVTIDQVPHEAQTSWTCAAMSLISAKGTEQRPLSCEELWVKLSDCPGRGVEPARAERAFDRLQKRERLNGAGEVVSLQ